MQKRNNLCKVRQILVAQQKGGELAEARAVVPDVKAGGGGRAAGWIGRRFRFRFDSIGRERIKTVGNRAGAFDEQFCKAGIVRAKNQQASGPFGERLEFATDRFQVGVVIEMFGIHVQYNGVFGLELAKRTVAFIGFDDEKGNLPLSRSSAFAKATADRLGTLRSAAGGEGWGEAAIRSAVVSYGFVGKKR